jgi:hypothetical protein
MLRRMAGFFSSNIGTTGRLLRGIPGAICAVAAVWVAFTGPWWLALILGISGAFMLFEAFRGWCIMRACGVRTKW